MKGKSRKWFLILFVPAVLFFLSGAVRSGSEENFSAYCKKVVAGYGHNTIYVQAPSDGNAVISVYDKDNIYVSLKFQVKRGMNELDWNGLSENNEKLIRKEMYMTARMTTKEGESIEYTSTITVGACNQALVYFLPSSGKCYLQDNKQWFAEYKLNRDGMVVFEFRNKESNELEYSYKRRLKGASERKITAKEIFGKNQPAEGLYSITVYADENPEYSLVFDLNIINGAAEILPVEITGSVMPDRNDTDERIWEKMIMPATVIDKKATDHQKVYVSPDTKSRVLGTLHGQSQALDIIELTDKWAFIGAWNHENASYIEGWIPRNVLITVLPQKEYGLLLDKKEQTLTVFKEGKRIQTLLVSTGRIEKNALFQETAAGSFLTDIHKSDFSMNGSKYDYVIRYDGGNLLHQIPYEWGNGKKNFSYARGCLGAKASHGCVRIQAEAGPAGINAYWLWTHIPYHTRVIILDDEEAREEEMAILNGTCLHTNGDNEELLPADNEILRSDDSVILTFGGDTVIGTREYYWNREDALPEYVKNHGMQYPFRRLRKILENDDMTICNLECVLQNSADGEDKEKTYRFRGISDYAAILTEGSVEAVNIANNHTIDYGASGYQSTIDSINGKVLYFGNSINRTVEIKGHIIGFGGCRETTYLSDPGIIQRDIDELKASGAEYIIYQCHWGKEYSENHTTLQEAMARACVRAGAHLIIGHHPHVVQGIQIIDGVPVFYSLGNLMFGGTIDLTTNDAVLLRLVIAFGKDGYDASFSLIPIQTSGAEKGKNDYCPYPASDKDAARILKKIQNDTAFQVSLQFDLPE